MKIWKKKEKLAAGAFIIAAGAAVFFYIRSEKGGKQINMPPVMNNMGEGVVAASGLTAVGMVDETWDLDFLQTALYVEESYLSTGDEVEKGTAVFKVSDETLKEARKELEDAVTEAELACRQGIIDYETGVIDARVTSENAAVNKKYGQAQYDHAAAEAAQNVKDLEKQIEEARELADEYTKSVNEDYYRTYYKIDELYQTYYEHFNLLMETYEKWDIEEKESLYGNSVPSLGSASESSLLGNVSGTGSGESVAGSSSMEAGSGSMGGGAGSGSMPDGRPGGAGDGGAVMGGYSESETLLSVYNLLDEMVKQEAEEYETALENYETAERTARAGLEKARSNLATLEAELATAQTEYEKQLITCQSDYEITLAESDNAQAVYEITLESLKETLNSLENEKEDAAENLALFEEVIGDGYFYTRSAGTIVINGVRKHSYLSGESLIIAYSDPEKVSVSANVDQSDIAEIAIGDSVYVVISEYGNYQGKVTMINPVTQARSRTSVTYQVTVTLEGDVSALDANLTAYVYFGMSDGSRPPTGENPGQGNRQEAGDNRFPGSGRKEEGQ